jgi:hypothetical protein
MAVRIEGLEGPVAGWRFIVKTEDVSLGRGTGHHISIADPSWQDGALRLQHRQGGWLVTNSMPHGVFLDGRPLAPGKEGTWYEGAVLQPTAATLLRLNLHGDETIPDNVLEKRGVIALPPRRKSNTAWWQYAVLAFCLVLIAALLIPDILKSNKPSRLASWEQIERSTESLKQHPRLAQASERLQRTVGEALLQERRGRLGDSARLLLQARDEADRLEREAGKESAEVLEEATRLHSMIGARVDDILRRQR